MPTIISHGVAAVAIGKVFLAERTPARFWILSILCAMLPDIDVVGFAFGIRYSDMLGHRGLTHSLSFALVVGLLAAWFTLHTTPESLTTWVFLSVYFFIVTASHGLLDAMTNGGLGVAFFAPFSNARYFFGWRPIEVSPLALDEFFSARGLTVLWSEIKWIWIPSAVIVAASQLFVTIFKR
ncbi:MAG: metal-dependent hydrolase [Acidobacteria bacterium]|nr:MAG: metal-dependent hydrolase [Acidobacteriota bacterium]